VVPRTLIEAIVCEHRIEAERRRFEDAQTNQYLFVELPILICRVLRVQKRLKAIAYISSSKGVLANDDRSVSIVSQADA